MFIIKGNTAGGGGPRDDSPVVTDRVNTIITGISLPGATGRTHAQTHTRNRSPPISHDLSATAPLQTVSILSLRWKRKTQAAR